MRWSDKFEITSLKFNYIIRDLKLYEEILVSVYNSKIFKGWSIRSKFEFNNENQTYLCTRHKFGSIPFKAFRLTKF